MCRLFAQIAPLAMGARDLLVDSEFSLLRQADADSRNPQTDGWGLAWFDEQGRAHIEKSGAAAPRERARFERAADTARSSVVLAHIRAASNQVIDDAHAHPFEDEGWVFAHNGTLTIAKEVAEALGPRRRRLKTDSDSEVYFQQFLKHLRAQGDASRAFEACIAEDWRLWEACRGRYPEAATPYTSLNAIASDGRSLQALCHASRRGTAERGVCHPEQPWSLMSYSLREGRFLLASEGVDGGGWTRLSAPETLAAVLTAGGIELRRHPLALSTPHGPVPEVARS